MQLLINQKYYDGGRNTSSAWEGSDLVHETSTTCASHVSNYNGHDHLVKLVSDQVFVLGNNQFD